MNLTFINDDEAEALDKPEIQSFRLRLNLEIFSLHQ
jgi:hypothetical protein